MLYYSYFHAFSIISSVFVGLWEETFRFEFSNIFILVLSSFLGWGRGSFQNSWKPLTSLEYFTAQPTKHFRSIYVRLMRL